jgi:hypothetical protein
MERAKVTTRFFGVLPHRVNRIIPCRFEVAVLCNRNRGVAQNALMIESSTPTGTLCTGQNLILEDTLPRWSFLTVD